MNKLMTKGIKISDNVIVLAKDSRNEYSVNSLIIAKVLDLNHNNMMASLSHIIKEENSSPILSIYIDEEGRANPSALLNIRYIELLLTYLDYDMGFLDIEVIFTDVEIEI